MSATGPSPPLASLSKVKPAYAPLGELAAVLEISGVGDRLARLSCVKRCGGIGRGNDGDVGLRSCDPDRLWDSEDVELSSEMSGFESLRFLLEDVMSVSCPSGGSSEWRSE